MTEPGRESGAARRPTAGSAVTIACGAEEHRRALVEVVRGSTLVLRPVAGAGELSAGPPGAALRLRYAADGVPCGIDVTAVADAAAEDGRLWVRLAGEPKRLRRRTAVRARARLMARVDDDGPDGVQGVITDNLSAAGALLRSDRPLGPGERVRLELDLGGPAGTVETAGRVVRCDRQSGGPRPWRVAVVFDDVDEDRRARIDAFVLTHMTGPIGED